MSKNNGLRKAAKLAAVAAGAGAMYLAAGNVLVEKFLSRPDAKHGKDFGMVAPSDTVLYARNPEAIPNAQEWFFAFSEKVELVSLRGNLLHGNIVRRDEPTHRWAICCHGYTSRPSRYAERGWEVYKMGFHVLFPNFRGHGDSEERLSSMGYYDSLDLLDWITYIVTLDPEAEIFLYGVSMGAATVMMATGHELPANVKCAVEDCGYTSVWDEFSVQIGETAKLPRFPFLHSVRTVVKLRMKFDIKDASPLEAVRKSRTPTLFMHGEQDGFVPFWMLDVLYDNAVCQKARLVIPGAGHAEGHEVAPELYWGRVREFVQEHMQTI